MKTMKEIKDRFVPANLWYFVCGYLNDTRYQPIFDRHLERYDEKVLGPYGKPAPQYQMAWMDFELFQELAKEAVEYYASNAVEITEENIDKYAEK